MFKVGDKVKVLDCPNKEHIGKEGTVTLAYGSEESKTQPVSEYGGLPKGKPERHYSVKLDSKTEIHRLTEKQLRKL